MPDFNFKKAAQLFPTVIAEAGVEGYNYTTWLATGKLAAGDYFLRIGPVASSNPLMAGFTDKDYSVSAIIAATAVQNDGYAGKTKIVSKAGEIICAVDGEVFVKRTDGEALAGLYRNKKGAIVPCLVSKDEAAVSYLVMSTGMVVDGWTTPTDEDYYYSYGDSIECYVEGYQSNTELPLYFTDVQSQACADTADAILEQQAVEKAGGKTKRFFQKHGKTLWIALAVVAGLVLWTVFWNYAGGGSSTSSTTSRSSGGSSSAADNPTWRDIDDMQTANNIAANLRDPNYDPESFSSVSDTESFGPPCE